MLKNTSCAFGKDIALLDMGQIIGMQVAEKASKEIPEASKIGLRNVQGIIKIWKDSEDPLSANKDWSLEQ